MGECAGPIAVISPHLDDGVLGCGRALASNPGGAVITVCAGMPDPPDMETEWDAACGFHSAAEALAGRREEDRRALALLGAVPHWLDFSDDQYGRPAGVAEIAAAMRAVLERLRPAVVYLPMGLFHRDHRRTHEAARQLVDRGLAPYWYAYEEPMYRRIPGLLQERLADLRRHHVAATPVVAPASHGAEKRRAVAAYRSQLRGLASAGRPGHVDALGVEGHWRLDRLQRT